MEFVIGYDLEEFDYDLNAFRKDFIKASDIFDNIEKELVNIDPSHLIAFREKQEILGWAIWHESSTFEHHEGDPRDEKDRKILEKLVNGKKECIELHELWLKKEHRGKGYGIEFFEFFEKFVYNKGYNSIIYYADDPAAIALCRKRGYKEEFNEELQLFTFCKKIETL